MKFLSWPELEQDDTKQLLKSKGYWFYVNRQWHGRFFLVPVRPGALWFNRFTYSYYILSFLALVVSSGVRDFLRQYPGIAVLLLFVPLIVLIFMCIFLNAKIYDPGLKDWKAMNKGKRKGMYTSDQSLYTTQLEGVYVCETCSTPVATTDDKISTEGQTIRVRRLIDDSTVEIRNTLVRCRVCDAELGQENEIHEINLNGAKLALDIGELHYIYADSGE